MLKGELESPGSVSNDTMTVARDMTKERADEFQTLCSAALYNLAKTARIVVGCGHPGQDSLRPYGLSYEVLMRLAHHRLIINDWTSRLNIGGSPSGISYLADHQGQTLTIASSIDSDSTTTSRSIFGILFTSAGEELSRVVERIPVPEYTQAMLEHADAAVAFPSPTVCWFRPGTPGLPRTSLSS